ncbi:MAG: MetS family NSS transporter small subunit [Candidatus Zixiibacteriota bacterium]
MPFSAILMMIITALILYGGIAICVRIAIKKKKPNDRSNSFSR